MWGIPNVFGGLGSSSDKTDKQKAVQDAKNAAEKRDANQKELDERKEQYNGEASGTDAPKNQTDPNAANEDDGLMTADQFIKIEKRRERYLIDLLDEDENIDIHKRHVVRRWAVRIWNIQVDSMIKDECKIFININWGGDRREARISTGESDHWWNFTGEPEVVWGIGYDPQCFRTDVMPLSEKGHVAFANEFKFEWKGSYAQLESESMGIELWRYSRVKANSLDSTFKDLLVSYAKGPVFQQAELIKAPKNADAGAPAVSAEEADRRSQVRFRVSFQLYFQEIYDFELNLVDLQAFYLMSHQQLERAGVRDFEKSSRIATTGIVDDEDTDPTDTTRKILSILDASESEVESEDDSAPLRRPNGGPNTGIRSQPNLSRRKSTLATHKKMGRSKSQLRRGTQTMNFVVTMKTNDMSKRKSKLRRKVEIEVSNATVREALIRGNMNVESQLIRTDQHTKIDRWGNIGKIHYRGTLADLDNDLIRLKIYEATTLSPVTNLIAEASVSLRGVYEYGNVSGACSPPGWVIEKAKRSSERFSSEDVKTIMKSTVARFEAKIAVENLPKYKQSGELCDMIPDKAYLLVKILRVDRLAIPDQRPINQCDSAVQVQFSGNSYETEVRQDTISPQFNQEFYFELKTNTPSEFSPDELASMHGPISFDVWLRSDDEGAVTAEHVGHAECNLLEIFAEGKPEMKTHNSIRTGEITEYRTAVLKARKRLVCLWSAPANGGKRNDASMNVPASAQSPCYLFVDIWLRPFDFMAFSIGGRMGSAARLTFNAAEDGKNSAATLLASEEKSLAIASDRALPTRVKTEFIARARLWEIKLRELKQKFNQTTNRFFDYFAQSQNRDEHLLPLFLDVVRPPETLANPSAIAFWVHCISHTNMEDLKAAVDFWSTTEFTLSLGKGDTFAHALLHCSMLRGLPASMGVKPFVCVGTTWDSQRVAWVMTMQGDGSVTFWETGSHRKFHLPNRCADLVRCKQVARNKRLPGQMISSGIVQLEARRRLRLIKQDSNLTKMKTRVDASLFECDPEIFRTPETLKLYDPTIHPHALIFSTNIPINGNCMSCDSSPDARVLYGYICNKQMAGSSSGEGCLSSEPNSFLCLTCANKLYLTEDPLMLNPDGTVRVSLPPYKCAQTPVLPYKTIDIVFDSSNIWMNLQHFNPGVILYDFWNPLYWHPFTTVATQFQSFTNGSKGLRKAKSREYFASIRNRILTKLVKSITAIRRNGNLSSFIQRDRLLIEHLETGMELLFRSELIPEEQPLGVMNPEKRKISHAINEWKLQLYSKVPSQHRLVGYLFQFSFFDSFEISRIVAEKINFLSYKELGTQLAVSCFIGKLPNNVIASYVYIGLVFPLGETVAREVIQTREQTRTAATPFTDEILEQQRLYSVRVQIFDSDADFLAQMRNDLFKEKSTENIVLIKQNPNSRPPIDPKSRDIHSSVDYPKEGVMAASEEDALLAQEEEEIRLEEEAEAAKAGDFLAAAASLVPDMFQRSEDGSNNGGPTMVENATTYISGLFNGTIPMEEPEEPVEAAVPQGPSFTDSAYDMAANASQAATDAASYLTSFLTTSQSSQPAAPIAKPLPANFYAKKAAITSPLPLINPVNPSPEELHQIYQPKKVQIELGVRQYLRHIPSGFSVPIPPQDLMKKAVEMGAGNLTRKVHVTKAQEMVAIKKIDPPKIAPPTPSSPIAKREPLKGQNRSPEDLRRM